MNHLAEALETHLADHYLCALRSDSDASVRPIFVGPPLAALRAFRSPHLKRRKRLANHRRIVERRCGRPAGE